MSLYTQGKNSKPKEKTKKLKQKTQGFGKIKNVVCRKSVEKKADLNILHGLPVNLEFSVCYKKHYIPFSDSLLLHSIKIEV